MTRYQLTLQEENSTNSSRLKVCLSNLHEHTEISKTYIRDLGGIVMKDVIAADILMTSDAVNLTVKVLGAIMLGLPIVTYKWLSMSVAEGEFAGENFIINIFRILFYLFLFYLRTQRIYNAGQSS